ncbi:MAG: hypothetical protein HC923_03620, partial [Myxococcales bacterium]|nr:hypothetical protein [Myxococcales bacterium]
MARIELQINAETPDELQEILAGLVAGAVQPETTGVSAEAPGKRRGA